MNIIQKWTKFVRQTLSLRLSFMVVSAIAALLIGTLVVMFHFSRLVLKDEAMRDAENTLESTAQQIDNVLMSVEQSSGNIYFDMLRHLDKPEMMFDYARELVKCNPYIVGCAIVFKPNYYPGHELYMAYVRRKGISITTTENVELETRATFANRPYTEQIWYKQPMESGRACWTDPLKNEDAEGEALVTFCLPIYDKDRTCVGVLASDLSIELLSQIVLAAKPSPNGYSTLLADNGSFIVHPDTVKLNYQTVFSQMEQGADPSVLDAAEAMVNGEEGFKSFYFGKDKWHVFYKPFKRMAAPGRSTDDDQGWSVGVVYPEDDIYREYNDLLYYLLAIVIIGCTLIFIISRVMYHRQLLPLVMLTQKVQRIAEGNYDETIPDTNRMDEVGQLQGHFQRMQKALAEHVGRLEELSSTLKQRNAELAVAYQQAQQADRMKTAFLHNMTNQMVDPSNKITISVTSLCDLYESGGMDQSEPVVETISNQSKVMVDILKDMLKTADKDQEKGGGA